MDDPRRNEDAGMDLSSATRHWSSELVRWHSPLYKRLAYAVGAPLLDVHARRFLSARTLALPRLGRVYTQRGFPLEARRTWAARYLQPRGKRLLVLGTGSGWDLLTWLWLGPRSLIGVDGVSFRTSWGEIQGWLANWPIVTPEVSFAQADLGALPLAAESVDGVVSDSVFEHCRDLRGVLLEACRVLRPGGHIYAAYGPLWSCFGGDHFSGRGGLAYGYQHLAATAPEYARYVQAHLRPEEDAQTGPRYVALDLFSRIDTRGYLALYEELGLEMLELRLGLSSEALAFRRAFPEGVRELCRRHPARDPDDLVVQIHFVVLRKPVMWRPPCAS
ncbi:MAG: class I SAM-dependent methyltransferase [Deltaproteobacteria bacterium]|nr:class I SAM-dependent methyltransferase [Deltaproteobacteria bacterium]